MTRHGILSSAAAAGVVTLLLSAAGCHEPEAQPSSSAPPPASASVSAPDRLEAGELAEGPDKMCEINVPRGMAIRFRTPFALEAEGKIAAEQVANYIRKRMKSDGIEVGAARTIFNRAQKRDDSQAPFCTVEVAPAGPRTRLTFRDLTPEKSDPSLTPEELMRRHGLDPTGRLADPTHME